MTTKKLNTIMSVKMFLISTAFWVMLSSKSALAVTCSSMTNKVCEITDFTSAACDSSNICICTTGFPIDSGCAKNLGKPVVKMWDPIYTNIVVSDANATLICSVIGDIQHLSFEWIQDGQKQTQISQQYIIIKAHSTNVGRFSCQAKYGANNASVQSDPLKVTLFSNESSLNLNVTGVPLSAAEGSTYTAACVGIPVGANFTFFLNNTIERENPFNTTDEGNITCAVGETKSNTVNTPSIVSNIGAVSVTVELLEGTDFILTPGNAVNLLCTSDPKDTYMNVGAAHVSYTFTDITNSTIENTTVNNVYKVEPYGNHTIFCSASYNNQTSLNSTRITIRFIKNYMTAPVLAAQGTDLIWGSRLVLTCGQKQEGITYNWFKDENSIYLQYDRIIQLDNVTETDAGMYYCTTKEVNYIATSNKVNISLTDDISVPNLVTADNDTRFYEKENYQLVCKTSSATAGMTYTWMKDGKALNSTTQGTYNLTISLASKDTGNYSCLASFNNRTTESEPFNITAENAVPGKPCNPGSESNDCNGKEYKKVCTTSKPYRCECAAGYTAKDKVCNDGISNLMTSSIIVAVVGFIASRLM